MEGWNFAFIRKTDYFHTLELNVPTINGVLLIRVLEDDGKRRSWRQIHDDDRVKVWEDAVNFAMVDSLMSG